MRKIFIKKQKKDKNDPAVLKKLYIRLQIEFLIMFAFLAFVIYSNYDYILFKILISQNYIYTDTLDEIYKSELGIEDTDSYTKNFDEIAISLVTKEIRQTNGDRYTYLYLPDEYDGSLKEMEEDAKQSHFEELNTETAYMQITNFSKVSQNILFDNVENLQKYDFLILDLRYNGGGYLPQTYKMADLFLPNGAVINTEIARSFLFSGQYTAKNAQKLKFKHIYILQNEYTASSAEVMVNALKENLDNVTVVGTTSFGKGIGQAEFKLKNDYAVKATVIKLETPNGNSIHKIGITPDIEYTENDIISYVAEELIPSAS